VIARDLEHHAGRITDGLVRISELRTERVQAGGELDTDAKVAAVDQRGRGHGRNRRHPVVVGGHRRLIAAGQRERERLIGDRVSLPVDIRGELQRQ
jgi:hypothetical protein